MYSVAIIGFGGMGKWHYRAITKQIEGLEVTGVYDIREEACEEARFYSLHVYESATDVFADLSIDIVIIATPNDSHKDLILRGLAADKHVVCEKPVVLNSADLLEIMEAEKNSKGLFTIHQNRRWDKDFRTVKSILDSNSIGRPYFIESRVNGSSVFLHGWRDYKINGGGMLFDWGVHLIDQGLLLIGEKVTSVTAHVFNVHAQEVDDNVKLLLGFESGLSVLLEIATNCFIPMPRWHLSGANGTAIIENWECEGKIVQLADDKALKWENDIVYTAAGPTRTMAPRPVNTTLEKALPQIKDALGDEYHHYSSANIFYNNLLEAISGKKTLYVTSSEALRVMQIIELAFQSAAENRGMTCSI
ncbi:MAG: Gfo/Idh/MocA family oxidoreductase [Bacillota bacterium]|nr:Gfo/Idh/MocA family oxidoreductase [Bacillota bacterium]